MYVGSVMIICVKIHLHIKNMYIAEAWVWLRTGVCDKETKHLRANLHLLIPLHLNFVAGRQKGVEADNELWVATEELGDSCYHSWGIDGLGLEFFHDV